MANLAGLPNWAFNSWLARKDTAAITCRQWSEVGLQCLCDGQTVCNRTYGATVPVLDLPGNVYMENGGTTEDLGARVAGGQRSFMIAPSDGVWSKYLKPLKTLSPRLI
jgi:hypothetical protein